MREGWIKSHRKITDSAIWSMPPLYLKVWQYLLHAACFEEKNIPMKNGSFIKLEKGQHLTSIRVIAGKVSWYERGIEKSPNPKTISEILEWLITQNMIQIENGKNDKQYSLITIVNWVHYQTGNETEGNNEQTEYNQSPDIKNNYNNSKKEKEEKKKEEQKEESTPEVAPTQDFIKEFNDFWDKYPRKHDRKKTYKCFTEKLSKGVNSSDLIAAASGYSNYCSSNKINMVYIKYPCNFLSEDQYYEEYVGYTKASRKSSINLPNPSKRIYGEYDLERLLLQG